MAAHAQAAGEIGEQRAVFVVGMGDDHQHAGGGAEALERLLERPLRRGLRAREARWKLGSRGRKIGLGRLLAIEASTGTRAAKIRPAKAAGTAARGNSLGDEHTPRQCTIRQSAIQRMHGPMISSTSTNASNAHLERRIGLRSAVLFNMLEMIGVGPFITLPLVIAAAGYRLSVWAWVLGAAIAVADGLVWAELGAAFPRAGGSYAFLREIYGPDRAGNWLSFLYVWQLSFSAPLSIASGCIGLSSFLAWFWPGLERRADRGAARAALRELCRGGRVPAGDGAALSQSELDYAAGLGAVCGSDGGDRRRDRLRLRACSGDRRLAHAGLAGDCRLRLAASAGWRRLR